MTNSKLKNEIILFVVMTTVYFTWINIANELSDLTNMPDSIKALAEIIFPLIVIFYLKKKKLLSYYGLNSLKELNYKSLLFCIPMIIVALNNLRYGFNIDESPTQIILHIFNVLGVGFSEEILFRGFLMKPIMRKSPTAAVITSSLIFGMIHIFNIFYGGGIKEVSAQVIFATAIGLMYALFFYKTNNIIPCMICHSLTNMNSMFLPDDLSDKQSFVGVLVFTIPSVFYVWYLYKTKKPLMKADCEVQHNQ